VCKIGGKNQGTRKKCVNNEKGCMETFPQALVPWAGIVEGASKKKSSSDSKGEKKMDISP